MTNDESLLAEIEKMIVTNDKELYERKSKSMQNPGDHEAWWSYHISTARSEVLDDIRKLVIADRAKKQKERKKMIEELNPKLDRFSVYGVPWIMRDEIRIIVQGKEEEASK